MAIHDAINQYARQFARRVTVSQEALLVAANVFVVVLLVVLWQRHVLPIEDIATFVFLAALVALFALARPLWTWWFFVGALPLEAINLAPAEVGLAVRPYQLIGVALVLALSVRALSGRLPRRVFRWRWQDTAVVVLVAGGVLAALTAQDVRAALVQAAIVASFGVWFFLARYFVRGPVTARMPLVFFLSSSAVVVGYGLWQSFVIAHGGVAGSVMAARPNATFSEPDWLGVFLVGVIALIYGVHAVNRRTRRRITDMPWTYGALGVLLLGAYTLLIVSVVRSAWLGAACVVAVYLGQYVLQRDYRGMWNGVAVTVSALVVALICAVSIPLTTFDLAGRAQSTASGLQEITVACDTPAHARALEARGRIEHMADLADFTCRHINLEDVDAVRARGETVTHVLRPDPSHGVRRAVYARIFALLRAQWSRALVGTGWHQADLGVDAQGAHLNTSNIFLEVWLGSGLAGVVAFVALVSSVAWRGIRALTAPRVSRRVWEYGVFAVLGMVAIVVPNMFNAGILLGFVWVFLGMMATLRKA